MFPKDVPEAFEREYGCTEADWLRCLPEAVGPHDLRQGPSGVANVTVGAGVLHLRWGILPERKLGAARLPRMNVAFRFESVAPRVRGEFMRYFDLSMQRGGG